MSCTNLYLVLPEALQRHQHNCCMLQAISVLDSHNQHKLDADSLLKDFTRMKEYKQQLTSFSVVNTNAACVKTVTRLTKEYVIHFRQ